MIHVELDGAVRDTPFLFEVVSHDTETRHAQTNKHALTNTPAQY